LIVLAIDPGSVTAGYAVLTKSGSKIVCLASGVLKFNKKESFLERVSDIYHQTENLIAKYTPDQIAIESLIYVKSPTALIKLAQARGAMLAAMREYCENKVFEYSPNLIKSTVTGHGHADKESIQKFLQQTLGISSFLTHDESDAIAIAFCHLLHHDVPIAKKNLSSPKKVKGRGLSASLSHRIKEPRL